METQNTKPNCKVEFGVTELCMCPNETKSRILEIMKKWRLFLDEYLNQHNYFKDTPFKWVGVTFIYSHQTNLKVGRYYPID